jgi:type II secretory pathway pseudopilin PulG
MDTDVVKPPRAEKPRAKQGLLEALVSLCVLVTLAGVVVPIGANHAEAARIEQTETDLADIARGLQAYTRDTGLTPTGIAGDAGLGAASAGGASGGGARTADVTWLYGPGELPRNHPFGSELEARPLADALLTSVMGGERWSGPYATGLRPDPWGRAYLVNVDGLVDLRESAMVLSAGPDGVVETAAGSVRPGGDDLIQMVD